MLNKRKNDYNHVKLQIAIGLSAVAAVASVASLVFGGTNEQAIFNALAKMEALKAGGTENRNKVQQLYNSDMFKSQQAQAIDAALQRIGGETTTPDNTATTQPTAENTTKTLSQEQINAMKANGYVEGNKDAKFIIVEYTDPECPFCVRQYKDKTIETVMNSNKDVAHIMKVVQGVNHTNTEFKSLAIICGGKLKGEKGYYSMFNEVLGNTQGTFPSFTLTTNEQVIGYAEKLGIKKATLEECMANADSKSLYGAYRQEAVSLGASGTPGNIIINTENGKYTHLAGAYPATAFQEALTQLQ